MAKRLISLVVCAAVILLAGCAKVQTAPTANNISEEPTVTQLKPVEIDLSDLSVNVAYSEVYNMYSSPQEYEGKTVRVSGLFSAIYENVEENDLRFTCQISDATACCSVGIEFQPDSSLVFPDDFPLDSTRITVSGTLKTKNDEIPIYISDAVIEV